MAIEHLNTLVAAAGLEAADLEAIMALPAETKDFTPDTYVGKIRTNIETQVKNDPKFWEGLDENNVNDVFKKKIEAQQYGRAANIVRQKALKALGLKDEDFADMSEDDKKNLELFIGKAGEKFASTKVTDKQMQAELLEARKKYEELETAIPAREGKIKQDAEAQYNSEKLDYLILAELATVEGLRAPAQYLLQKLATELKGENAFVIEGLKAHPKQKANPALDILDGTKVVSLKDLIVKKLTADGLIEAKTDAGAAGGKGKVKVEVEPDGKTGLVISGHIQDKIDQNKPAS